MNDWGWWLALNPDERINLANAEYRMRRAADDAENARLEARGIFMTGKARIGEKVGR